MHYLIRLKVTKDVLGIISAREVLGPSERITDSVKLYFIVQYNLNFGPGLWDMEHISQAEYETYRDLHGFRVLKKPIQLTCPSGTKHKTPCST